MRIHNLRVYIHINILCRMCMYTHNTERENITIDQMKIQCVNPMTALLYIGPNGSHVVNSFIDNP